MFVICSVCGKRYFKETRRVNESKKRKWKFFCSKECLKKGRLNGKLYICENPKCENVFYRNTSEVSSHNYCSRSCHMVISNTRFPKRKALIKICAYCGKDFKARAKFCSKRCKDMSQEIPSSELLAKVKVFYKLHGRIPLKREFTHYRSIRTHFGTWNNAIIAAGFKPNPVMFAKKYIAKDGHRCDSLAEKVIDDWLYRKNIVHDIHVKYPGNLGFSVDFKVEDYWIEFFGLYGQHKKYDELMKQKLILAKKYNLKLVAIYPADLFPRSRLVEKLDFLHTTI